MGESGFSLVGYSVPITPLCPVAGLVGVCDSCRRSFSPEMFSGRRFVADSRFDTATRRSQPVYTTWVPPPMVQPVPGEPVYLLLRGFTDEQRLGRVIREMWGRIPDAARQAMREYLQPSKTYEANLDKGALRVEALPNWPERVRCFGTTMNSGHAIRLHSPKATAMPDDVLATLVAYHMAGVYRVATAFTGGLSRDAEEDAPKIMQGWGFRDEDIDDWHLSWRRAKQSIRVDRLLGASRG
jgi:hypothetical protein